MNPGRNSVAVLALFLLVAVAPLAEGGRYPDDDFWLVAQVVDSQTRAPLANASVVVGDRWERPLAAGLTDSGGGYEIELANGDYSARVEHDGYFTLQRWFQGWGDERHEVWEMTPAGERNLTLAGRVTDDNGTGLANVSVTVEAEYEQRDNWGSWFARGSYTSTVTDGSGNYSLALRGGESMVRFERDGYFTEDYWDNFTRRAEEENTTYLAYNASLAVRSGDNLLRGYVRDTDGTPVPGVRVAFQHERPYQNESWSDSEGYYELHLPDGNYSGAEAWADGFKEYHAWNETLLMLPGDEWYNFTLTWRNASVLHSGTVYDAQRLPVANATVELVFNPVAPGPAPGESVDYRYIWNATATGENGQFQLGGPQCGGYQLRASATGYFPSQEDGPWIDTCRDNLLVELYLPPAQNATVSGRVTFPNSTAAVGWHVSLDEIDHGGQARYTHVRNATLTDAAGNYEMEFWGVPTQLQVHRDDSRRFAAYENYTWNVRLSAGTNTLDIMLEPSQSNVVRGNVTDDGGQPVEGVEVYGENWFGWNVALTNATGHYELEMLTGSEDWFDVWWQPPRGSGLGDHYRQFYFDEGETVTFDVTLLPREGAQGRGTLYGYLTYPNSSAVEWGEVEAYRLAQWGYDWDNRTQTRSAGYYEMNVSAGDFELWGWTDGAYPNRTRGHLEAGETQRLDLVLTPYPPRDRLLRGYVNTTNGTPLAGTQVFWGLMSDQKLRHDREHRYGLGLMFDDFASFARDWNYTNASGYYELWVPAERLYTGAFDLAGDNEGSQTRFINVESSEVWVNYTLGEFVYPAYTLSGEVRVPDGQPWDADVLLLEVGDFLGDRYTRASGGGRFSFPVGPGDYVLVIDEGDNDAVVERITITGNHNGVYTLAWPERTLVNRTLLFDDWSTATLYQNATLQEDAVLARFMADYYFGDDDGTVSASEAVRVAEEAYWDVLGGQATLLPGGTSHGAFALEGVHYQVNTTSFSVSLAGAVGSVWNSDPLVVRASQGVAAMTTVPTGDYLDLGLWTPYEETIMRYHYRIVPPDGWALDGHNNAPNVIVAQEEEAVAVTPQGDPLPWDEVWEVWVELQFASTAEQLLLEASTPFPEPGVAFTLNLTAAGSPVAGAQVVVSWKENGTEAANLTTDAAGQVTLNLSEGLYWAVASKEGYREGKLLLDVAPAGARLTATWSPTAPTSRDTIVLTVRNHTGGSVGLAWYRIERLADGSVVREDFTDSDGNASFTLVAGEYLVTVNKTGYRNGTLHLLVDALKLRISIDPLYAVQGEEIVVMVRDEDGYAVAGATLTLYWVNNNSVVWSGITNASGQATLTGLEGQYRLEAEKAGYEPDTYEITVHPYDEQNPEREDESFLPGPGLLTIAALLGLVARRRLA